jgi:hypothetical protein
MEPKVVCAMSEEVPVPIKTVRKNAIAVARKTWCLGYFI